MGLHNYGAGTDVGHARDHNEDAYLANEQLGLWVVADGMGGHEAGEVASAIAVQTVNAAVARGVSLEKAMNLAHRAILQGSKKGGPGAAGMGCTCVAARIIGARYEIAWVGDSRAYHWSENQLSMVSHDHSYVQTLVDLGVINEQEAIDHPDRSVLTQCLGSRSVDELEVGLETGSFVPGDGFLLCSDGLTGEVSDQKIAEILGDAKGEQVAVDRLIIAALDNGGSDNVTAILVSPGNEEQTAETRPRTASMTPTGSYPASEEYEEPGEDDDPESQHTQQRELLEHLPASAVPGVRGGAATGVKLLDSDVLRVREERYERAQIDPPPPRKRQRRQTGSRLKQVLFMRISPSRVIYPCDRWVRLRVGEFKTWIEPMRQRFYLLGLYSRRAVLALGVLMVGVGVAGGLAHG